METPQILFRIETIAEAQRRFRVAFVASLIVSLSVIFGVYNGYLSWYRGFAFKAQFEGTEVSKALQRELLRNGYQAESFLFRCLGSRPESLMEPSWGSLDLPSRVFGYFTASAARIIPLHCSSGTLPSNRMTSRASSFTVSLPEWFLRRSPLTIFPLNRLRRSIGTGRRP
jgi:hypothetical protein